MNRLVPCLATLSLIAVAACDEQELHRAATVPAPAKLDLSLEPTVAIDPCNGPEVVEAHPGTTVNLCVRVTTPKKEGKGKNARMVKAPKAGEPVVFRAANDDGLFRKGDSGVVLTDAAGEARVVFTVGSELGQQSMLATTSAGVQTEVDVMVTEISVPLATVGQPHPDTYPTSRGILSNLSERVFGKPVSGVR